MTTVATKTNWIADNAHSEILFKVRHMMMTNVKGEFRVFDATVTSNGNAFADAMIDVSIDTSSILTNSEDRDNHLKSEDFFDVEKHNKITFKSTSMTPKDKENYIVKGDLAIKGVVKEIEIEVAFGGILKDPWGGERAGFSVTGELNRKDFGLNWNTALEAGGVLVGDTVKFNAEVQFVKQNA